MLAGYEHFLALARSVQWDDAALDLSGDAAAWPALDAGLRERVTALVFGFCVGEAAVAEHLDPFADAAEPLAEAAFRAQAGDEARHARFFERVRVEVLGGAPAVVPPAFAALFGERLPQVARDVARDAGSLPEAVGLYHMVLEGAVFTAGQLALSEILTPGDPLPGVRRGVELVLRDERWHIGLGTRCLLDAGVGPDAIARVRDESERAVAAWGPAIPPDVAERVVHILRRRLAVIESGRRREPDGLLLRPV